jgi:hypothetical protein
METVLQSLWADFLSWWHSNPDLKLIVVGAVLGWIGIILGWILAQFAEIFRARLRKWRLKKALYKELWDVGQKSKYDEEML